MDTLSVQIFSNQPEPTISITVNGGVVCAGGSSTLTAVANLPVTSYEWERRIGNGNWTDVSGGATLPTGTLTQTTCYRVTITTLCGTATSAEACVTVMPNFTIGTPNGMTLTCTTNALTLIAVPNPPNPNFNYSYSWTGPNGITGTGSEFTVTAGGAYTLVVTGTGGGTTCTSIPPPVQILTNQASPTVVINPPSPVGVCPGDSITLTASVAS
jgi:hypothetical protein